jgi:septum formation protein
LFANKKTIIALYKEAKLYYNKLMKVILASKSPRRKQLLGQILDDFQIVVGDVDESIFDGEPTQMVQDLALAKAKAVPCPSDTLVIGCDTIVVMDGKVYGKPTDRQDAIDTLTAFSGRSHFVYTGVAIVGDGISHVFYDQTQVVFKQLSRQQIDDYVACGSPMDKAGSYGIQDSGFVSHLVGSYDNVVGFPTQMVAKILSQYVKTKDYQEKTYG